MAKKQLYTIEYQVKCSPSILYDFLSTATGLREWFADNVDEKDGIFSISWNGSVPDKCKQLDAEENKRVRYQWLHEDSKEYFEFEIVTAEISNQTILLIHGFAEKDDIKDETMMWDHSIKELLHRLGS